MLLLVCSVPAHADELRPGFIIPSVFDVRVGPLVAQAVAEAAVADGVVRNLS